MLKEFLRRAAQKALPAAAALLDLEQKSCTRAAAISPIVDGFAIERVKKEVTYQIVGTPCLDGSCHVGLLVSGIALGYGAHGFHMEVMTPSDLRGLLRDFNAGMRLDALFPDIGEAGPVLSALCAFEKDHGVIRAIPSVESHREPAYKQIMREHGCK